MVLTKRKTFWNSSRSLSKVWSPKPVHTLRKQNTCLHDTVHKNLPHCSSTRSHGDIQNICSCNCGISYQYWHGILSGWLGVSFEPKFCETFLRLWTASENLIQGWICKIFFVLSVRNLVFFKNSTLNISTRLKYVSGEYVILLIEMPTTAITVWLHIATIICFGAFFLKCALQLLSGLNILFIFLSNQAPIDERTGLSVSIS